MLLGLIVPKSREYHKLEEICAHFIIFKSFRTLFGGSVGPNRKQMPDNSVQYHYDGIQVRKVPLPLRVPLQAQQQSQNSQPQTNQPQTIIKMAISNGQTVKVGFSQKKVLILNGLTNLTSKTAPNVLSES